MSDADLNPHSNPPISTPAAETPAAEMPVAETPAIDPATTSQHLAAAEPEEVEFNDVEFDDVEFDDGESENVEAAETFGAEDNEPGAVERVSKLLARAGLASRRAAEDMIAAGRVTVNGHTITEQGFKADPYNDRIIVDGHPLRLSEKPGVVLVFHKPRLVMTTKDDPGGRPTVMDYLPRKWQGLHPVGRLDFDTSGVLLLTDDGELTHLLTHPSHGAEKVYEARVRGTVEPSSIEKLERGIRLDDGPTAPCRAKLMAQRDKNALLQLVLREGRNRQVRRMLEAIGHPANALRRVSFAGIELEGLPSGEFRVLLPGEIKALRKRVESKVKKLSAPKGKFHKQKVKKPDEIKAAGEGVETEPSRKRSAPRAGKIVVPIAKNTLRTPKPSSGSKPTVNRPRNSPNVPEKPPLERKGSKARPYTSKEGGQTAPPRPSKPRPAAPRPAAPRPAAPRPAAPRPAAPPRSSVPRTAAPRPEAREAPRRTVRNEAVRNEALQKPTPRAPRAEENGAERAPVAKRVEKRWKS